MYDTSYHATRNTAITAGVYATRLLTENEHRKLGGHSFSRSEKSSDKTHLLDLHSVAAPGVHVDLLACLTICAVLLQNVNILSVAPRLS